MAKYLVCVMAAAQNKRLMYVWDAAATSCLIFRRSVARAESLCKTGGDNFNLFCQEER